MPIVKYGGGVTDMRGSVAGNVHARNKSGSFMRARTKPRNPNSTRQCNSRALLSQLNTSWMTQLNDTQRNQWNTYAASIATKNKLGESVHLTGFSQFLRSNQARMTAGLSLSANGPTTLNLPEKDPSYKVFCGTNWQIISVYFDDSLPWCSENGAGMSISQGAPKKNTCNFFKGPYRFLKFIPGSSSTPAVSPFYIYTNSYTFALNQRMGFFGRVIRSDGRCSNEFTLLTDVTYIAEPTDYFLKEHFNSYNDGPLSGQGGWGDSTSFLIQSAVKYEGSKAVKTTATDIQATGKDGQPFADGTISIALRRDVSFSGFSSKQSLVFHSTDFFSMILVSMDYNKITYKSNNTSVTMLTPYVLGQWYRLYAQWRSVPDNKVRYKLDNGAWTDWVIRTQPESTTPSGYVHLYVIGLSSGAEAYFDYIDL